MKKIFILFLFGYIFPNIDGNISFQSNFGKGQQVFANNKYKDLNYFENLLQINLQFTDKLLLSSELEYSNPPIKGKVKNTFDTMFSNVILNYVDDDYSIVLGDLYTLYGYGLSMYTYQNRDIDYDNSILGAEIEYYINYKTSIKSFIGKNNLLIRKSPEDEVASMTFENQIFGYQINYFTDNIGEFNYFILLDNTLINKDDLLLLSTYQNSFGYELSNRLNEMTIFVLSDDSITTVSHDMIWSNNFNNIDFTLNNVIVFYKRLLGEKERGNRFYFNTSTSIGKYELFYEYKNYDTPFLMPFYSNPPIGFKEGNSVLTSRLSHGIDFSDEIGHQLEVNTFFSDYNIQFNLSQANNHGYYDSNGKMKNNNQIDQPSFIDLILMENTEKFKEFKPYTKLSSEISGYFSKDFYFKTGVDLQNEHNQKGRYRALTIPSQFTYTLQNGNSIVGYLEQQNYNKLYPVLDKYKYNYFSIGLNFQGKITLTYLYENELHKSDKMKWDGYDVSINFGSYLQCGMFYGSQKGGLICANGSCVYSPGFENGFRFVIRSIL